MYADPVFREERTDVLHVLMREHAFATLITLSSDGLVASHIPLALEPTPEPFGTLRGHLARANPQWQNFDASEPALAIFSGPQSYITPSWYPSKRETGRVVPTWNYLAVHAYGPLRTVTDGGRLREHLETLTDRHESGVAAPWQVDDAPDDFIEKLVNGIVGLEIPISRLEGTWKLGQNRSEPDRAGVLAGLSGRDDDRSQQLAAAMRQADS